jgi:hypothetical protein
MDVTIDNSPAHTRKVAEKAAALREQTASAMGLAFWTALGIGGLTAFVLVVTWMLHHSH